MNTGTFLVYQYCLKMWYLYSLEHAGVIQKLTILERKNGLVLSNTRVPVSGTWSILFAKYLSQKFFRGPPSDCKKNFRAPFMPWKLRVNPIEKHVNSISNGKSVVIFFRAPLTRVKNFKGPLFASGPPYKCLWMVPYMLRYYCCMAN